MPMLTRIPPLLLARVHHALAALHAWNDVVREARRREARTQQPGRYEYALRSTSAGATVRRRVEAAQRTLTAFETSAPAHGVDLHVFYAQRGGKPALLPEGALVQAWGRGLWAGE
jgi:hypothetical protein